MGADRDLDIVLFGATGFVGRLCAEYLSRSAPAGTRIALAGRSRERTEAVRLALGSAAKDWPVLVADSADAVALAQLAQSTRVVVTTVGPYRQYGMALVEACVAAGTHYADLTGEVLFMRDTIDRFDALAGASGARIVHSCGFDSIPSDLGVLVLHEAVAAADAGDLRQTTLVVKALKGGVSGGTLASAKGTLDAARSDPELARLLLDPYALSPNREAEPQLGSEADPTSARNDPTLGIWLAPFVMGRINTRVVRRSNALRGWEYGRELRYSEAMGCPSGPRGAAQATALAAGARIGELALSTDAIRGVLDRVLPSPGQGPSVRRQERGFFRIDIHTQTSKGAHFVAHVGAQGDPGYRATAVMLGESGLCLALDDDRLPGSAGVLTPATGMGTVLVDRLRAAGQTFAAERLA